MEMDLSRRLSVGQCQAAGCLYDLNTPVNQGESLLDQPASFQSLHKLHSAGRVNKGAPKYSSPATIYLLLSFISINLTSLTKDNRSMTLTEN